MFYILNNEAPLPSRDLVLSSTESKTHLTQLLIKYRLLTFETCLKENSFYMTSEETKKKVKRAIIQEYKDIMSEDEEAQANHVIKSRNSHAEVQPEDTDVFYLLLHFYYTQD